jgi:hypothetical protein
MPTAPKPACQLQRSAMTAAEHHAQHRSQDAGEEEGAEHGAAHAHREEGGEQRRPYRAVGGLAEADDGARTEELGVARGQGAGDGREAPHQRHQEDALDAAPAVGEQRQRNGA